MAARKTLAKESANPAIGAVQIGRAWYWRTATRRYGLTLQTDLFGSLVLIQTWSGIHNQRGGSRQQPVADLQSAVPAIQKIFARRRQHRYQPVAPFCDTN
jgi:WGR domain